MQELLLVWDTDEILDPYICPYDGAIAKDFILMDNNAQPHRTAVVENYLVKNYETVWSELNGQLNLQTSIR